MLTAAPEWFKRTFIDIFRQLRWSFLPPLMVYFAAGISGLTAIVGTFFVKEFLGLSAAFLAALTFWTGLPWALKMPVPIVNLIRWRGRANRAMLPPDVGRLQIDLVAADRVVPIESEA